MQEPSSDHMNHRSLRNISKAKRDEMYTEGMTKAWGDVISKLFALLRESITMQEKPRDQVGSADVIFDRSPRNASTAVG